jgi:hypothetical protein
VEQGVSAQIACRKLLFPKPAQVESEFRILVLAAILNFSKVSNLKISCKYLDLLDNQPAFIGRDASQR